MNHVECWLLSTRNSIEMCTLELFHFLRIQDQKKHLKKSLCTHLWSSSVQLNIFLIFCLSGDPIESIMFGFLRCRWSATKCYNLIQLYGGTILVSLESMAHSSFTLCCTGTADTELVLLLSLDHFLCTAVIGIAFHTFDHFASTTGKEIPQIIQVKQTPPMGREEQQQKKSKVGTSTVQLSFGIPGTINVKFILIVCNPGHSFRYCPLSKTQDWTFATMTNVRSTSHDSPTTAFQLNRNSASDPPSLRLSSGHCLPIHRWVAQQVRRVEVLLWRATNHFHPREGCWCGIDYMFSLCWVLVKSSDHWLCRFAWNVWRPFVHILLSHSFIGISLWLWRRDHEYVEVLVRKSFQLTIII